MDWTKKINWRVNELDKQNELDSDELDEKDKLDNEWIG